MTAKISTTTAAILGSKGGKAGTGKAKARDPEKMRRAAMKRWRKLSEPNQHEEK